MGLLASDLLSAMVCVAECFHRTSVFQRVAPVLASQVDSVALVPFDECKKIAVALLEIKNQLVYNSLILLVIFRRRRPRRAAASLYTSFDWSV